MYSNDYIKSMYFVPKDKDLKYKIAEAVKKVNWDGTRSKQHQRKVAESFSGNGELEAFKILVRMFLKDPTDEDLYNELIKELDPDQKQKTHADVIIDALNGYASDKPIDTMFHNIYAFHGITLKEEDKK